MSYDQTTIAYVQKRQTEGKTRREIIRCLKRTQPLLYCPDQPVSRAQMASFIIRSLP